MEDDSTRISSGTPAVLSLIAVCAGYGTRQVLMGTAFEVFANEVVGLVGDNGAGKSTILRTISGLIVPVSGDLVYLGNSIQGLLPHQIQRRGIGYVMQGGRVFPNLTVAENIAVASARTSGNSIGRPNTLYSQLQRHHHMRAGLLSGGERQLLAIHMILTQEPRLLLLDEPTANLAPSIAAEMVEMLAAFARSPGHAVIIVEQDRDVIRRVSTRTLTVNRGNIVNQGAVSCETTRTRTVRAS